jgi:FKBP-type peptidyl-prolyl cis-trans isomerase FklB
MDKISYALGMSLGNSLINSGITSLQWDNLIKGIQDVMEKNELAMTYDEAQDEINNYFEKLQGKMSEKSISEGKAFLEKNGQRPEVITLKSGLQYEIIKEGNGKIPQASDKVKVHYHGTLLDGTVFDSSVRRGEPATFGVTQVISGWV